MCTKKHPQFLSVAGSRNILMDVQVSKAATLQAGLCCKAYGQRMLRMKRPDSFVVPRRSINIGVKETLNR